MGGKGWSLTAPNSRPAWRLSPGPPGRVAHPPDPPPRERLGIVLAQSGGWHAAGMPIVPERVAPLATM
jgi:hypothetical protein